MILGAKSSKTANAVPMTPQISLPNYKPNLPKFLSAVLVVLDLMGLYITTWVSAIRTDVNFSWLSPLVWLWAHVIILIFFYIFELYKINIQISGLRAPQRTIVALFTSIVLIFFVNALVPNHLRLPLKTIVWNVFLFMPWAVLWRFFVFQWSRKHLDKIRWLVVDHDNVFTKIYPQFVRKHSDQNFFILSEQTDSLPNDLACHLQKIGCPADLPNVKSQSWSGIVVTNPKKLTSAQNEILMQLRQKEIVTYNLHQFFEEFLYKIPVTHLENDWFLTSQGFHLIHNPIGLKFKRLTDFISAIVLLIILSPMFPVLAALIKFSSKGPVIFKQKRTGLNEHEFTLYKFRTMREDAEKNGAQWATQNDPRVTPIGKFFRSTRLDELPQLWNVLKGDMSFIGPRPERPVFNKDLEKEIPFYQLRHLVKPGITGWAQVLYPYGASVEDAKEKLEYDLYYIKNYSFLLDISIFFKTVRTILLGRGR